MYKEEKGSHGNKHGELSGPDYGGNSNTISSYVYFSWLNREP